MNAPWNDPRILRGMKAQLGRRRELLKAGGKPLGWKVGFGAPAAMERFQIKAPLVGYLMQEALVSSKAAISIAGWAKPVAEPEIAVHIGKDLPGGSDREAAKEAIAGLGPAIELADLDPPPEDVEKILAGNIYQRQVILGSCDPSRSGGNPQGLVGRILRQGAEIARTSDLQANTGELLGIVRHVADLLEYFGERLRAGEVIIAGSVVPPLFIEKEETAVAFELDPIGEISVRLTMN